MKVVTVEQMIELERRSGEVGTPPEILMENAGLAVARRVLHVLGDVVDRSIMILVGPGNNGGDGLVAGRHLHDWGADVYLYLFNRNTRNDKNFSLDQERGIWWMDAAIDKDFPAFDKALSSSDLVIDSLFGTGKTRPMEGILKQALERVKREKEIRPGLKILAMDLPSGLNADTGAVDPACLTPDLTVTLGYAKIGLFQFPGAAKLGRLEIADIGIPADLAEGITTELTTAGMVRSLLPPRLLDANKGTFGRLLVVAGSINYVGAAYLACEGAMRVGTGLVTLAMPESLHPILAGKLTEATYMPLPETKRGIISSEAAPVIREQLTKYDAMLLGCGLGQDTATVEFVRELLLSGYENLPKIIDADGLNILTQIPQWWQKLGARAILTPHPGEMSRLTGMSIAEIQNDRLTTALKASKSWGQTVVLKGAHTVIASPDGKTRISGAANPGLASAGTGDVLAGAIAGMMAQGLQLFDAATCGVYLHAAAGELVKAELGDAGMIASDLLPKLPLAIKELRYNLPL
ncbi:MAG: NAD(P)H-hydrate dehydratase [Dehalococcoidia bacterium]|nr:NAD(P)H-hydrate dehydratase [Dehalococcoidia bacterium]